MRNLLGPITSIVVQAFVILVAFTLRQIVDLAFTSFALRSSRKAKKKSAALSHKQVRVTRKQRVRSTQDKFYSSKKILI